VQNTETRENIPNGHKIDQMATKYTNIFHCQTLQNLPKIGIFGLKINHVATLVNSNADPRRKKQH
jgi:hypothetical protein